MAQKIVNSSEIVLPGGRTITQVPAALAFADRLGSWRARWGIGRMNYIVAPGLYAVGSPTAESTVLVTANYKMSFDRLRSELDGRDAWILVLDTNGINVWCAAGKGTFGTQELLRCIEAFDLKNVVEHRKLVLPQLGAVGVSAHDVQQHSGFRVVYGPVRADDLPAFLDAGMKATREMREVRFPMWDRIVLIPIELVAWAGYVAFAVACIFLLAGLSRDGYSSSLALASSLPSIILLLSAYVAGAVLGPVLLPWLPGKAFAAKGMWIGLAMAVIMAAIFWDDPGVLKGRLNIVAWALIMPVVTSFVVMNFTGASTYTSLSGVKREMTIAIPLQIVCGIAGAGLWLAARFA